MDTPGIEPGAFRMQSGRATTALCAQQEIPPIPTNYTTHSIYHTHHAHDRTSAMCCSTRPLSARIKDGNRSCTLADAS